MLPRNTIFPNVIEMNVQAGRVMGCNVYLVFDQQEWILIDIGYDENVDEIVELIRQMDFPLSQCKTIVATHADVDHIQGLARRETIAANFRIRASARVPPLESGDKIHTFAEIGAQEIHLEMPPVKVEHRLDDGDVLTVGSVRLDVWLTPGHTDSQLSFRLGNLLFSGDNIYRDGGVGAIDAHHGSNIPDFIKSLQRIRKSDVEWLLPSHGPIFRKNDDLIERTINRLETYLHMPDFGTCAVDWPLIDEWDREIAEGWKPR